MALTAIAATAVAAEIEFLPYTEVIMIHTACYSVSLVHHHHYYYYLFHYHYYHQIIITIILFDISNFLKTFLIEDYPYVAEQRCHNSSK